MITRWPLVLRMVFSALIARWAALVVVVVVVAAAPVVWSAPAVIRTVPADGSVVAELISMEVEFSEDVSGVDAGDLTVNGVAASGVWSPGGSRSVFHFPQPDGGRVELVIAAGHGIVNAAGQAFAGARWSVTLDLSLPPPRAVITEILAENRGGRRDEDGATPDWIEIHNPGAKAVDLGGWCLSDTAARPTPWRFPAPTLIPPGGWLVVFASGKNRAVSGHELHTDFKLDAAGESVVLVKPDGRSIASQIASYPPQRENVSFGVGREWMAEPLIAGGAAAHVLVPEGPVDGWTLPDFDDTLWSAGALGVGFDVGAGTAGDGLLGWWPFDEAAVPTRASDATGQGRDGVVARATYSADGQGRRGVPGDRSLVFNGTGVVSFPAAATGAFDAMAARDAFTISLWAFGAASLPADNYVFYGSSGPNGGGTRVLDAHLPWSDSVIYFDTAGCCDPAQTRQFFAEPDPSLWRGRWNHYVFVKNGDTKQVWQNGKLRHQTTNLADQTVLRSLFLGAQNAAGATGYRGRLDDFALWEGALDGAAIAALAAGTAPPDVRRLTPVLGTDLARAMHTVNASAYIRLPFTMEDPSGLDLLALSMRYDDGFVAFLNGVEVARRQAPETLTPTATATAGRPGGQTLVAEEIDLSAFAPHLRAGVNVLAVHGLNRSADDGDFLVLPELRAGRTRPGRFFTAPTPGAANGEGVAGFVEAVTVSPARGFFEEPVTVTLTCATPGATISVTTDGSVPTPGHGTTGASPLTLTVSRTTTLRATAFLDALAPSGVATHTFLFVNQVATQTRPAGAPVTWPGGFPGDYTMDRRVPGPAPAPGYSLRDSLLSIPTLSLVTDPAGLWGSATGIYTYPGGRGREWERFASMEWMDPASSERFQAGTGLRIHGNISRNKDFTPKHSFHLRFRGEYGDPTLRAPLFPGSAVATFDELVLRAGSTDTWPCTEWGTVALGLNGQQYQRWNRNWASYIRDQWVRDAHLAMGHEDFRGRFCHLYLNGCYWGLYNIVEAPSASHMAEHLGGAEHEWDTVADFNELREGTRTAWDQLLQMANGGQLGSDAGLRRVQGLAPDGSRNPALPRLLDVDNLIDYMILHIAIGADDWPDHNWWGARRSRAADPEGFRFFAWDQEISNENVLYGRSAWGPIYAEANADGTPTRVYARLRGSPEFRQRFADRIQHHLFHGGALSEENNVARWLARVAEIDRAVVAESARWGDAQPNHTRPGQPYTRENAWLPHLAWMATQYWPKHQAAVLARFRAANLWPTVAAPQLSPHGGPAAASFTATLSHPNAAAGTVFYTTDGQDPRQWGGGVHPSARGVETGTALTLNAPVTVKARVRQGTTWSPLAVATFGPAPAGDADADGMEDAWETAHGLAPTDASDAGSDADADGATALEEFLAGTDPRVGASVLRLEVVPAGPSDAAVTLRFALPPGRIYTLERSATLAAPEAWSVVATFGPEAAARTIEHSEPVPAPPRFYRLRATRP